MRSWIPATLLVYAAACTGWFWHIAQDHGTPSWARVPVGMLVLIGLIALLYRRLEDGIWPAPDLSGIRIVPPPRVARWCIVAVSTYPAGGEQVIGRYRSHRVAAWIAGWLPKRTGVRLEVRASDESSRTTETSASEVSRG
ncbi:hypothetical protein [Actinoplanes sp. NPDC049316]|uniref:hypothetical protein n=1 Tax=Actinoplanes sp. NPDC049316 TaxID=3154727 RepID=UPI00344805FB